MLGLELGEREGQHLGLRDVEFAAFPAGNGVWADAEGLSQLSLTEAEGEALGFEVGHSLAHEVIESVCQFGPDKLGDTARADRRDLAVDDRAKVRLTLFAYPTWLWYFESLDLWYRLGCHLLRLLRHYAANRSRQYAMSPSSTRSGISSSGSISRLTYDPPEKGLLMSTMRPVSVTITKCGKG